MLFQLADFGEYVRLRVGELGAILLVVIVFLGVLVFVKNVAPIDCAKVVNCLIVLGKILSLTDAIERLLPVHQLLLSQNR